MHIEKAILFFLRFGVLMMGCIVIACLVTACGVTPTRIGEGVRGVIDRTEDKRSDSDAIIYYPKPDK